MLGSPTITVKGRNLLAKIVAAKIPLTLSYIGLGDGLQEETEEVISLANEIMKKEIESCNYSEKEGQYYIRRVFTNADLEEGFYIREVGIYAIDPDEGEILYAYTNAGENGVDYFAPGKGKVIVKEIIEMATKFGNAENITVVIDPSIALVSEKEFEEYKNSNKVNTDNLQEQIDENTAQLKEKMNHSLLINKDFQVWQRGNSFDNVDGKYTADRWFSNNGVSGALQIEKVDGGLKMTWSKVATGIIAQTLDEVDKNRLVGKKLSCAISVDGVRYTYTTTISTIHTYVDFDLSTKTFATKEQGTATKYYIYLGQSIAPIGTTYTINYVDDAIGESIGEFMPRSYGEESALCQRYYQEIQGYILSYVIQNANILCFNLPYITSMRTAPTLTFKSIPMIRNSTAVEQTGFTFAMGIGGTSFCTINATKNGHGLTSANLCLTHDSCACLDAEIY